MLDELLTPKKVAPALRQLSPEELRDAFARGDAQIRLGVAVPRLMGGSVTAAELVFYNSANMTVDSVSTTGGAIDTLRRPDFTQMAGSPTEKIDVVSSAGGDTTQTVTITGRLADGTLASETLSLNGTTPVSSTNLYERLLKAEMSATAAGTVSVKGHTSTTVFRTIPIGERGFQAMFQQLASSASGATDWYEKIFVKNTDGTLALTSATVTINADPNSVFTFWLEGSLNGSTTVTNRTTAPGGSSFTTGPQNVANSQSLSAGAAQAIWMKLHLATSNVALRSTVTMEIDGNTT